MHGTIVTLYKHLGNASGGTEVAVNLEGRMGIKHIGIGPAVWMLSHRFVAGQKV